MIIQNALLLMVVPRFLEMIEKVQKEKMEMDIYRKFRVLATYLFGYLSIVYLLYYFVILKKESIKTAFMLGVICFLISDFTVYWFFDDAKDYFFTFLFDSVVVGGGCFAVTTYLVQNYSMVLEKYIGVMILVYLVQLFILLSLFEIIQNIQFKLFAKFFSGN